MTMNDPVFKKQVFKSYNVWPNFPSISISGTACALNCRHCEKHYLGYMTDATNPQKLIEICEQRKAEGAKGVLISGGCDENGGLLNLKEYLPAIRKVHETGLIIKLHTGLVDAILARKIVDAGIDIASQEMVGDDPTISEIFGIEKTADDFLQTFIDLRDAGIPHIAPHIVIGLNNGKLVGEERALELLASEIKPSTIALIVIRPTKGTAMADIIPPSRNDICQIAKKARDLFPETKIILGALRPRDAGSDHRFEIELGALDGGVDGMEVPSSALLAEAEKRGYSIKKIDAFGVLPIEYEDRL